ncbi:hypothetical protein CBW18_10200 [Pedobacter sp. AJM]|nr:hypothetical protein CBW18_10200 [Pedobacter sp. AJM]
MPYVFFTKIISKFTLAMHPFQILSFINGLQRQIHVFPLAASDTDLFKISIAIDGRSISTVLSFSSGHWRVIGPLVPGINSFDKLEIDSIGHRILEHCCCQLANKLQNFQSYI